MAFTRNVADQARAADALPANIGDGVSSRGREPEEVRHRTAGGEQACRACRKLKPARHPVDDAFFDVNAAVIAAAAIGVECGRSHFREHAAGRSSAVNPAPEARMGVAGAKRQDQFAQIGADLMHVLRKARRRFGQALLHRFRHGRPHRTVSGVLQSRDQRVQQRMSLAAEGLPVRRVEQRPPVRDRRSHGV
jgi:hypothetical protein